MTKSLRYVALCLAASLAGSPAVLAEELAPGVTYEVLKEHPAAMIPGATSIKETLFVMQPGSTFDAPASESTNFCTAVFGELKVEMGGETVVRRVGDQWMEPKGAVMLLRNEGTVPFVDKTFEVYY